MEQATSSRLFKRFNESTALQKHIQKISQHVETLSYAFAIDITNNIQATGNVSSFPDTLLYNNLLVYILGSKNDHFMDLVSKAS